MRYAGLLPELGLLASLAGIAAAQATVGAGLFQCSMDSDSDVVRTLKK